MTVICAVVTGFLAHFLRHPLDRLSRGLALLTSYSVGVILVFPFSVSIYEKLSEIKSGRSRFALAYFCAFAAFAVGVVSHYVLETLAGGEE